MVIDVSIRSGLEGFKGAASLSLSFVWSLIIDSYGQLRDPPVCRAGYELTADQEISFLCGF